MPKTYDEPLDVEKYPPVEFKLHKTDNSTWRVEYPFAEMGKNDFFVIMDGSQQNVNCIRNHARYFTGSKQPWAKFTVRKKDEFSSMYICRRITD